MSNLIKAIRFLGWEFLRVDKPDKTQPLEWPGGFSGVISGGENETPLVPTITPDDFINADASTYTLESLESLFTSRKARLAKIFGEDKMPSTQAYTVLSLGWTYGDSNNAPALIACNLVTHKLYFYHGTLASLTADKWQEFAFGIGSGSDDFGMRGDYCTTYGVVKSPYGRPRLGTFGSNTVIIPAGMQIEMPGDVLSTGAAETTVEVTLGKTCYIIYVPGLEEPYQACEQICFSKTLPAESDAVCRVWFDGVDWWYRSLDTGDIWRNVKRAQPLCKCIYTGNNITRLNYIGWYHDGYDNAMNAE